MIIIDILYFIKILTLSFTCKYQLLYIMAVMVQYVIMVFSLLVQISPLEFCHVLFRESWCWCGFLMLRNVCQQSISWNSNCESSTLSTSPVEQLKWFAIHQPTLILVLFWRYVQLNLKILKVLKNNLHFSIFPIVLFNLLWGLDNNPWGLVLLLIIC